MLSQRNEKLLFVQVGLLLAKTSTSHRLFDAELE